MTPSRRHVLGATAIAAAGAASGARAASRGPGFADAAWLQGVLERYAGFGVKASGGPGDEACGAWLEGELTRAGYACERHAFEIPFFEPRTVTLASGAARAAVIPQALVKPTGPGGVTAPLRLAERPGDLTGAIALITLPYKRWAGLADPQVARPLADAFQRGAAAAVAITTGPSGEAIALNVPADKPGFERPVALLAPKDAQPFLGAAAAGGTATLTVDGEGGRRPAWNLIARLDRKAARTLILSTPRSGWFTCVGERGSGLAAWLSLAHWLAAEQRGVNLELLATSGHEYIYLGGERYLKEKAPPPEKTALWVHIGASVAARDWHDLLGRALRPLPSADPQRVLTATADIIGPVRRAFRGVTGLEAVYPADRANAGGELVNVLEAGYRSAIGEYGIHRYFHTPADDLRCASGELVAPVAAAFRTAIAAALAT
jgi:hypothetical protein